MLARNYVPLWCKSNFSFLQGASHPEELLSHAAALGLPAIAITDQDGFYGAVRAHKAAQEHGIRLIHGAQITLTLQIESLDRPHNTSDIKLLPTQQAVALVMNRKGYANLCQLLTIARRRCDKGAAIAMWHELMQFHEGLLLLCPEAPPLEVQNSLTESFAQRIYGLSARHLQADEVNRQTALYNAMKTTGWPLIAATEVLYHIQARRPLQDVLTCIRLGESVHTAGSQLRSNAEHHILSPHAFAERYRDRPDMQERTLQAAVLCRFSLGEIKYTYPASKLPDGTTQSEWLRHLTLTGAQWRYSQAIPDEALRQIDKELALIDKLDYGGYFLSMWEIVQFCNSQGILCQGRGSAANSVVCYCLGITAIDPVRMGLLFERFLSLERAEPPDIDLDIEHQRREEVIQHVYGRFDPKHPAAKDQVESEVSNAAVIDDRQSHAAMVANVNRYRGRSAVREVGKALGLAETTLERVTKLVSHYGEGLAPETLALAGLDPDTPVHKMLQELVREIQDFPRHLSVHPGGFLLGHEPVDTLVPIENATMERRTVIQWDKDDVETLGLFKVDLLGLGMLSQIHRCFDLLFKHHGVQWTMATIPNEDPETYAMICRGDTIGVFQIESRAQMSMLPRLKPKTFYDLVVEVAIVRPGPITGGMVHPYLRRRDGTEAITYPHECLRPVLEKTLGVPLFQEQVMRLAMVAADYTPGEADQLRRDMAAWKKTGRIEGHRQRLVERMTAKGIALEFAERVFEQIRGFGEYGFPESHAASFALISYVTAWLKCHHPAEFACSLLNAQPMGFYSVATILEDAKRHGVQILALDVQHSQWDCLMSHGTYQLDLADPGPTETHAPPFGTKLPFYRKQAENNVGAALAVRVGLRFVKGLSVLHRQKLEKSPAPYRDLPDFVRRVRLDRGALEALAEAGGFDSLGLDRREALWQVRALLARAQESLRMAQQEDMPLFAKLNPHQQVVWDYVRSGHSARGHPLTHLRPLLRRQRIPTAEELNLLPDGRQTRFVGLVICRQRPGTAKGVTFFTLEDETGFVNAVLWQDRFAQFRVIATTVGLLGITGKIQRDKNIAKDQPTVVHLIIEMLWIPDGGNALPNVQSHDFR